MDTIQETTKQESAKPSALTGLGDRLRAARKAAGLSQDQVAKPEFTKSYISAVERGKARPSLRALTLISARLNMPIAGLLTAEPESEAGPDIGALDAECAYQLDHVELLLETDRGEDALRELQALEQTYGALLDEFLPGTQYRVQRLRGAAHVAVGEPGSARPALERALGLAEALDDPQERFRARDLLGTALSRQGLPLQALEHHTDCLQAIQDGVVREPQLQLRIYADLAHDYRALREPDRAIAVYEEARSRLAGAVAPEQQAETYWELGAAYQAAGDLAQARRYAAQALGILAAGDTRAAVAGLEVSLGAILMERGDADAARNALDAAARALEPPAGLLLAARVHELTARLALQDGDLARAGQAAERSLALSATGVQATTGKDARARAAAARQQGRALAAAGEVAERQGEADLADGRFADALQALSLADDAETEAEIRLRHADLLTARGDHVRAAAEYQEVARGRFGRRPLH